MSDWLHGVRFRAREYEVRFWMRNAEGQSLLPPRPSAEGCAFRVEFREHYGDAWIAFAEFASVLDLLRGTPSRSGLEPYADAEQETEDG